VTALPFTKMHGLGNDYVLIDGFAHGVADPSSLARAMSDRHTGVGGDGLILVLPPDDDVDAHLRMRIFNADGGEAEMCGNGIRCLCKLAYERGLCREAPMRVQTGAGVLELRYSIQRERVASVTVDMGEPILEAHRFPVDMPPGGPDCIIDVPLEQYIPLSSPATWVNECALDRRMTCVSLGNPHVVIYCGDVAAVPLETIGPFIEGQSIFPNRTNVHFAQIHARNEVSVRHWERGSGATRACGTGACAACVAGVLTERTDRAIVAHLPGGDLQLEWDASSSHVFKTGPAAVAFTGCWIT
jgi:diaminopimelate epimerase